MGKSVLILAYDFPPYVSVGGLRPYSWYQYLHKYGIYPVVITRQWANLHGNALDYVDAGESTDTLVGKTDKGTIIRTPYAPNLANRLLLKYGDQRWVGLRKAITAWYEIMQWFGLVGPKKELYYAARNFLKTEKVDVIIATGDPFVLFRYAHLLSKEFAVPWVADYRDPWIQDKSRKHHSFSRLWFAWLERKWVKTARFCVTVSHFSRKQIETNLKGKTYYIIPNGFEDVALGYGEAVRPDPDKLIIGFAGTLYPWHPWKQFLKGMDTFVHNHPHAPIYVSFFGLNHEADVRLFVDENFPLLSTRISFVKKLAKPALYQELACSHVFLLFNDYSVLGTKIYDYMALKRKILLCFKEDEEALKLKQRYYHLDSVTGESEQLQEDLIVSSQTGSVIVDQVHLQDVLAELTDEFSQNRRIACNASGLDQYTRSHQVEQLAVLIHECLNRL